MFQLLVVVLLGWTPDLRAQEPAHTLKAKTAELRSINITGNGRTREAIIRREMALTEGYRLHLDSLVLYRLRDSIRIQNTGLFTDALLTFRPPTDSASGWQLDILVKERWYIWPEVTFALADRNFNVWWTEQNRDPRRANVGLFVGDFNFRGNREVLRVGGQMGYTRRATLDYRRPYVDRKQRHGLGVALGYSEAEEQYFATDGNKLRFSRAPSANAPVIRDATAALAYYYRPGFAARHSVEVRYRDFRADDTLALLNPDFFDGGGSRLRYLETSYRYEYLQLDNWNYPLEGYRLAIAPTLRIGMEGLQWQAFLAADVGFYQRLGGRWLASEIVRGRVSAPGEVPYFLRSAMGGKTEYVRGYELYVIDGSHYGLTRLTLKYQAFDRTLRNVPFRFLPTIPLALFPKVFADAGWAHARHPGNSFLNNRPLASVGVGLDIVTAYSLKLRLEWAMNLRGEGGFFFHPLAE